MARSSKKVELKMGNGNGMLVTNLGVVWKLLGPPGGHIPMRA